MYIYNYSQVSRREGQFQNNHHPIKLDAEPGLNLMG